MSRKPKVTSELVSAAGTVFEIVNTLSREVKSLGGSDDDLRRILSDKSVARQIAELLVDKPADVTYPLEIDYTQSLEAMVAAGRYDYVNPDITADHFPVASGEKSVEAVLVHLDRNASDEEVLRELDRRGLRPGTLRELAVFGEQHSDEQRQYPIVALGSVWTAPQGHRNVGSLWENPGNRKLYLHWLGSDWNPNYRFLGVRKETLVA